MQLHEAIYYYLLKPKEAIKKSITFEYSFFVYLLASLSIAISAIYVIDNKSVVCKALASGKKAAKSILEKI